VPPPRLLGPLLLPEGGEWSYYRLLDSLLLL